MSLPFKLHQSSNTWPWHCTLYIELSSKFERWIQSLFVFRISQNIKRGPILYLFGQENATILFICKIICEILIICWENFTFKPSHQSYINFNESCCCQVQCIESQWLRGNQNPMNTKTLTTTNTKSQGSPFENKSSPW